MHIVWRSGQQGETRKIICIYNTILQYFACIHIILYTWHYCTCCVRVADVIINLIFLILLLRAEMAREKSEEKSGNSLKLTHIYSFIYMYIIMKHMNNRNKYVATISSQLSKSPFISRGRRRTGEWDLSANQVFFLEIHTLR